MVKTLMRGDYIVSSEARQLVVLWDSGSGLYECYNCDSQSCEDYQSVELKDFVRYGSAHKRRVMKIEGSQVRVIPHPDAPVAEDLFIKYDALQFEPLPTRDAIYNYAKQLRDSHAKKGATISAGELVDEVAEDLTWEYVERNGELTNDEWGLVYQWFVDSMVDLA